MTPWTDFGGVDVEFAILDSQTCATDFGGNDFTDIFWCGAGGEKIVWFVNNNAIAGPGFTSAGATTTIGLWPDSKISAAIPVPASCGAVTAERS